jgi:hypothetical protein
VATKTLLSRSQRRAGQRHRQRPTTTDDVVPTVHVVCLVDSLHSSGLSPRTSENGGTEQRQRPALNPAAHSAVPCYASAHRCALKGEGRLLANAVRAVCAMSTPNNCTPPEAAGVLLLLRRSAEASCFPASGALRPCGGGSARPAPAGAPAAPSGGGPKRCSPTPARPPLGNRCAANAATAAAVGGSGADLLATGEYAAPYRKHGMG